MYTYNKSLYLKPHIYSDTLVFVHLQFTHFYTSRISGENVYFIYSILGHIVTFNHLNELVIH